MIRSGVMWAALLLAAPATAVATELQPPLGLAGGHGLPHERVELAPAGLLAPRGPLDDLRSYAEAERRLLEANWGHRVVDWRADAAAAARSADAAAGVFRSPLRSADLTGDGVDDPSFFEIFYSALGVASQVSITALDGADGEVLWSTDHGTPFDMFVLTPGDLSGDGVTDLAVLVLDTEFVNGDPACTAVACVFDRTTEIRWDLSVVSGLDGRALWSRSLEGSLRSVGGQALGPPATSMARTVEAINAAVDVLPGPDRDGDGARDLVMNAYDHVAEEVRTGAFSTRNEVKLVTTRAEVIKSSDGTVLLERSDENRLGGGARLTSAGEDLLWTVNTEVDVPHACISFDCTGDRRTQTTIERIGGWTVTFDDPDLRSAAPITAATDRILVGQRVSGIPGRLVALDRETGEQVWSTETHLTDPPTPLPGGRLLLWEGWYPDDEPGVLFRARLRRFDAATGTDLFATERALPEVAGSMSSLYAYGVGDTDGDGTDDIAHAERHSTYENPPGTARTHLEIESGATGETLFSADRDRTALLFDGGQLQPGGPDDLIEASTSWGDQDLQLAAVAMPSGTTLWRRTDAPAAAMIGPSSDPGRGGRVVYGRNVLLRDPIRWRSRIDLLRGHSGLLVSGFGDDEGFEPIEREPADPPAEPPGDVIVPGSAPPPAVAIPSPPQVVSPRPQAAATRRVRPRARIVRRRGRTVVVSVTCECSGRLAIKRGRRTVGRAAFRGTERLRVRLWSRGGGLRVVVTRVRWPQPIRNSMP